MAQPDVSAVIRNPIGFLEFLKDNRYPVIHKSNIFFRDFQYGLWKYLQKDQSKVPYSDVERLAMQVVDDYKRKGILKEVDARTFELNMPLFMIGVPAGTAAAIADAPPKAKAAAPAAAATPAPATAASSSAAPAASAAIDMADLMKIYFPPGADESTLAKLRDLQMRWTAARARRLAGE
jgi:hypothetical protein